MGIIIRSTGMYVPDRVMTNADFEHIVDTTDEWITTRTGIRERRIAAADEYTSDLAAKAAQRALEAAGVAPESIDLIIVSTVTPDRPFPNTASIVQHKLGCKPCMSFDVEAACSGFLYALDVANSMLKANKKHRRALVIGAEKVSSITDYTDRATCVLFGDGAGAVLLENDPEADYDFYVGGTLLADGSAADILVVPAGGSVIPATHESVDAHQHYIKMGGGKTFQLAVTSMSRACNELLSELNISVDQIKFAVPHQANDRIIKAVAERIGMTGNIYSNIDRYGNTSSASIGICLDELNRSGQIKRGDLIMTAAFGAGLTWAALLIRW